MGNATSSALRTDDPVTPASVPGGDGPAFGSLATLGGPKKFKKKPVLVLDPEELEKAHMMFQDASAELLGEEVERPDRGGSVLGLAPIDDENAAPDDMGAIDDIEAGEDDEEIPSAEAVLRMTGTKPALDEADDALIAEQLEGLDIEQRIFPSLPLKSEAEIAAEEAAERSAAEAKAAIEAEGTQETAAPREETVQLPDSSATIAFEPLAADPTPPAHAFPVNPLPEPEAELEEDIAPIVEPQPEPEPEPLPRPTQEAEGQAATETSARSLFGDEPFLDFPSQPLRYAQPAEDQAIEQNTQAVERDSVADPIADSAAIPAPEHEPETDPESHSVTVGEHEPQPEPAPEFEPEPETEPEPVPSDVFEFALEEEWETQADAEAPIELASATPSDESFEPEPAAEDNVTIIEDEPVDGYAFMYANNPRARTLHVLADGESNSLRARLIKEREDALAELETAQRAPSIWARFTLWLRGLFA